MKASIYKTVIADDEHLTRLRLKSILTEFAEIDIIAEASDGEQALELINSLKPDLLFLDIQMPGLTGFEVLKNANHFPIVIFCTAYDDYALQAFETSAIDYIVKPIREERVRLSIEKLGMLTKEPDKDAIMDFLNRQIANSKPVITSFPVKMGDRTLFLKLSDISYFSAEDKYVTIHTVEGKKYVTDQSLKLLEDKLNAGFLRIHRALLVNTGLIHEINKHIGSRYIVKLDDKVQSRLVSGRNYSSVIKQITLV